MGKYSMNTRLEELPGPCPLDQGLLPYPHVHGISLLLHPHPIPSSSLAFAKVTGDALVKGGPVSLLIRAFLQPWQHALLVVNI